MEKILFEELVNIMKKLRGTDGCPWDKAQTIESLKPFLIEETYEVVEAIERSDPKKIQEELGDLLYQIIFLAQIGQEEGRFDLEKIIRSISQKMIRRHPHVFSDGTAKDATEVLAKWEEIKRQEQEKENKKDPSSIMDSIPKGLPAIIYAHRVQDRAARIGFDWSRIDDVMEKLDEEISELKEALKKEDKKQCGKELGDIFFTIINVTRFLGCDPEGVLRDATSKFIKRFRFMEKRILEKGKSLKGMDCAEMDMFWELAKREIS